MASSRRRVQRSSRQSLSLSLIVSFRKQQVYLPVLCSMLHFTYCVKNSLYKKERNETKRQKRLGIQRVQKFSESFVSLIKLTELHRTQKFMWLRP